MQVIGLMNNISPRFELEFDANGVSFYLNFHWNTREAAWYFSVFDSSRNPVVAGIKIVPSIFLMRQFLTARIIMGGDFCLEDLADSPRTSDVTFENFGSRYLFEYVSKEEMQSIGAW